MNMEYYSKAVSIQLPEDVKFIISEFNRAGYEAYAVGGCVRDSIIGRVPKDWDVTTSADPYEVKRIFRRTVDTGIEHGTVTVMLDKMGYEVTTYRIDGDYADNRHPDSVKFTRELKEDLLRRDFTINAMAYNDESGVVDMFGGIDDLNKGVIRAVGSPKARFDEDALRILRGVRFASQLGFDIDEETKDAMRETASHLKNVSAERIREELFKLVCGPYPEKLRLAHELGITKEFFPEWDECCEMAQETVHHIYDVADHTIMCIKAAQRLLGMNKDANARMTESEGKYADFVKQLTGREECAVSDADKEPVSDLDRFEHELCACERDVFRVPELEEYLKEKAAELSEKEKQIICVTMLLHDIGKIRTKTVENGKAHFYGHPKASSEMAREILRRLKCDNDTIKLVSLLALYHDERIHKDFSGASAEGRRLAHALGEEGFKLIMYVQYADHLAHSTYSMREGRDELLDMFNRYLEVLNDRPCYSLKDLAVSGKDLIEAGFKPGPELGEVLDKLLEKVIENPDMNEKEKLLDCIQDLVD